MTTGKGRTPAHRLSLTSDYLPISKFKLDYSSDGSKEKTLQYKNEARYKAVNKPKGRKNFNRLLPRGGTMTLR